MSHGGRLLPLLLLPLLLALNVLPEVVAADARPAAQGAQTGGRPCAARDFGRGSVVCVCNATYCDAEPSPRRADLDDGEALHYASSKAGLRLDANRLRFSSNASSHATFLFTVNRSKRFQSIIGWGATVTDSAGINVQALSEGARRQLIRAYFSEDGIEYNILRVPIGGTDCSTRKYTLHDEVGDETLGAFNLTVEDHEYKLPVLRLAQEARRARDDQDEEGLEDLLQASPLLLLASAWTAPPWMKTNNDFTGFGFLKREHYQTWADYHIMFLDAYEDEGFRFWGLTTGNEPLNGVMGPLIRFNSMGWTPFQMRTWVGGYLGPTLRASAHADVRILGLDDQRINLPWWPDLVMSDKNASQYIDGFAVHWYTDYFTPLLGLDLTHSNYPDKFILGTEASSGFNNWDLEKVILGSWTRAEDYFNDILDDLSHWVTGWMEWSLVLDTDGGPSWSKNFVDTSILVDAAKDEFLKQPTFYAMGHFSKFLPAGSERVHLDVEAKQGILMPAWGVRGVAFTRPDSAVVIVLGNTNNDDRLVNIYDPLRGYLNVTLKSKSFNTIIFW